MHHFVFKHRYASKDKYFNEKLITALAPSAKLYTHNATEQSYVQNLFKLWDPDTHYSVIEVSDSAEADKLFDSHESVVVSSGWWYPHLQYVLKDINRERIDKDAIFLKLKGTEEYQEDDDVTDTADNLNWLNRKFNKFMREVDSVKAYVSADMYKTLNAVQVQFVEELEAFRLQRKKDKAEANKAKNSLKAKVLRFATYKAGR